MYSKLTEWALYRIGRNVFCIGYDPKMKVVRMTGPILAYSKSTSEITCKKTRHTLVGKCGPSERVKAFAERLNSKGEWVTDRLKDFAVDDDRELYDDDIPF